PVGTTSVPPDFAPCVPRETVDHTSSFGNHLALTASGSLSVPGSGASAEHTYVGSGLATEACPRTREPPGRGAGRATPGRRLRPRRPHPGRAHTRRRTTLCCRRFVGALEDVSRDTPQLSL